MKKPAINRAAVWSVEVLAPDLFRVRAARGRRFPTTPSSAVHKTDWPDVEAREEKRRGCRSLRTSAGAFTLRDGGAWELIDPNGLVLFSSPQGSTGFLGVEPRLTLDLAEGESFFGLGEATGTFNRRGLVREFWNIDVLGHAPAIHPGLKSLYVSIPFTISLRNGRAAGLFWDNPAKQSWDLGQTVPDRWQMSAASGEIDLYLFLGPTVESVVSRFTDLTGHMPLPPQWALGYQQCRYSYETRGRLEEVAREFRRRKLPCDVLYLDIHHMDAYRVFSFGKAFPKPAEMIGKLERQGFKVVTIVDPGVKDDPEFGVLKRGIEADAFVKDAEGAKDFVGEVWPGASRFPDFLNPSTRSWWGDEQKALLDLGVAGFWNDMNEPANFARPDKTLAPDAVHRTGHGPRPHRDVHNLYGMEMARASREGALRHAPGRRPFVITRAGYAGIQRHALVWTGDTSSNWDHLNDAVQMLLNLSVSGVPFCGGDVGGFLENTTPELFTRWFQFAAFTPFFRNHTNLGTIDQEPWAFGAGVEEICRSYLGLRYRLLPYIYALFAEARRTGAPIMRPLFWHYQNDPVAVACGDQFLLGRDLLIAPVLRQGAAARSVYLPNDVWHDFWTGERILGGAHVLAETPPEHIPVYVRGGAILPLGPERQFIDGTALDTVQLHLWPGHSGELSWYEDDGISQDHEAGIHHRRRILSRKKARTLTLRFEASEGPFASRVRTWQLAVWNASAKARIRIDGTPFKATAGDGTVLLADVPNRDGAFTVEVVGV
jgi:alpha-glucosidase